ncbi:MAG: ATP synthase F1 subunit epsilon [Prevotella sp.]|nr:ATP synthase F1 subunit epsilon [Prevotella sp.]MDD4533247.1 ATP synthase F1 subunit epsilon [Prevotella sp.]
MLKLRIVSPEKVIFDGDIESITVPGTLGSFEILNNHAPIISSLGIGKVIYVTSKTTEELDIQGGFVEVQKNMVELCVEV